MPTSWCDLWEGPDDPTLYLCSLVGKALALGAWEERGCGGTLLQELLLTSWSSSTLTPF